jgi:hypothetical protein
MRQPLRHIEDTVTSIVVLIVFGAMGKFSRPGRTDPTLYIQVEPQQARRDQWRRQK